MALFSLVGFLGSVGICYRKSEARLRGLAPNRATLLGCATFSFRFDLLLDALPVPIFISPFFSLWLMP
jgi:hypothetical protein